MLTSLPYDIQQRILSFQEPKEIIALYKSCEKIFEETIKHTNFIVNCKVILSNEEIEWFKSKKIKLKLLEEYKIDEYENTHPTHYVIFDIIYLKNKPLIDFNYQDRFNLIKN